MEGFGHEEAGLFAFGVEGRVGRGDGDESAAGRGHCVGGLQGGLVSWLVRLELSDDDPVEMEGGASGENINI